MDKIFNVLLNKYEKMLENLQNGYPMHECDVKEMIHLLHILHFVSSEQSYSDESLRILAYYE